MSAKVILSSKGQIVIPKSIRNTLGLHYGSELIINHKGNGVLELHPLNKDINDFFGKGKYKVQTEIVDVDQVISMAVIENDRS